MSSRRRSNSSARATAPRRGARAPAKRALRSTTADERTERALSHVAVDAEGRGAARMVDVGAKPVTARSALARATVRFPRGLLERVLAGRGPKGPVEEVARVAGILAAKRTGELVPMCHPLGLDVVTIEFTRPAPGRLEIRCRTACAGRTGVEMEALTGAAIAALTVYDMTKALDPSIAIETIELLEKHGGRHGPWRRSADQGKR
ncbi:MAG: cyclic pyranopterin monophosphate synthase MoaC [Planctomycetes bacterium]|nr:cyclic pyranopterin monophosphate synthase MoaC [Planctomycetota bacterium]